MLRCELVENLAGEVKGLDNWSAMVKCLEKKENEDIFKEFGDFEDVPDENWIIDHCYDMVNNIKIQRLLFRKYTQPQVIISVLFLVILVLLLIMLMISLSLLHPHTEPQTILRLVKVCIIQQIPHEPKRPCTITQSLV